MPPGIFISSTKPSKIFISSTIDDLQVEREKIADLIVQTENVPVMSENITDVEKTPREVIEEKIKECYNSLWMLKLHHDKVRL